MLFYSWDVTVLMSPPIIILSDSDDAPLASSHVPTTTKPDPTLPATVPPALPARSTSEETDPSEEEEEVSPVLFSSFANEPHYRPFIGPMTYDQYRMDQYYQSQQFLAADDCPSPLPSHHSESEADDESTDSDSEDTASSIPPPPPPVPARRRKRVRVLEPDEPEPFGKRFKYHPNGPTHCLTARK